MNMKCDVFISYRRDGGDMTAMHVYQALKGKGYDVFYDLEVLRAGKFNEALLEAIDSCQDFVLILSPHALDRCKDEGDWVRREIAEALRQKKNIVPVILNGFQFPESLPEDIDDVRYQNGLSATTEYFVESMNRLCDRYLISKPADAKQEQTGKSAETAKSGGGRKGLWIFAALACVVLVTLGVLLGMGVFKRSEPSGREEPGSAATVTAIPETAADLVTANPETAEKAASDAAVANPEAAEKTAADAATAIPEAAAEKGQTQPESGTGHETPIHTEWPILKSDEGDGRNGEQLYLLPAMGGPVKRGEIHRIELTDREPGEGAWDVSEAGDNRIMAWIETEEDGKTLYLSAGGPFRMPEDMSRLFAGYTLADAIQWNGLADFSGVVSASNTFSFSGFKELDFGGVSFPELKAADGMFQRCQSLTRLNLTGASFSRLADATAMFEGCASLQELDVSGLDTSRVRIFTDMFAGCGSLRTLDVSGFQTGRAVMMNSMFDGCRHLVSLNLGKMDTSRVTSMENMFVNCDDLESLDVSSFDTSRVQNMNGMFLGCDSLLSLDVSGFDTGSVREMTGVFGWCEMLDRLDVSHWNTSACTTMSQMFRACRSLLTVDVSGFDTSSVERMDLMFAEMDQLETLDVSHFQTTLVTTFQEMFLDCPRLISLNLSGFDLSSAENMQRMFSGCAQLESIGTESKTFGAGNTEDMYTGTPLDVN